MTGVYGWIRDGVRRAVLLGFSDAVEQLGMPAGEEELNPGLAAVLHETNGTKALPRPARKNSRKRLGKSLDDIATKGA